MKKLILVIMMSLISTSAFADHDWYPGSKPPPGPYKVCEKYKNNPNKYYRCILDTLG